MHLWLEDRRIAGAVPAECLSMPLDQCDCDVKHTSGDTETDECHAEIIATEPSRETLPLSPVPEEPFGWSLVSSGPGDREEWVMIDTGSGSHSYDDPRERGGGCILS